MPASTLTMSVLGNDRSGVVARFTQILFETGSNIEALEEQVHRGFFTMSITATYDEEQDRDAILARLRDAGADLGMEVRARFASPRTGQRYAILVTKEPRCLEALLEADVPAEPVVVIGNHEVLKAKAEAAGLPFHHVDWTNRKKAEEQVLDILFEHDVDFIVLARFMKILSPHFVWRYRNRIINIHPSLLPAFPGASAYRQAYEKGVRVVGVTAHFVTPGLDEGPIIMQDAFRIGLEDDLPTIIERGQELEAKVLVEAVNLYLERELDVHWGRVWLEES